MPSPQGSRGTVWPVLCRAMHGWLKEHEGQRALIIDTDRPSWVSHETFYGHWMIALCLRLRWAQVKWLRSLFHSLCLQFQVDTAKQLAGKLRVCMDRDDSVMFFCQKWYANVSYAQKWFAFSKVVGTVKSEHGQACTSGT